MTNFDLKTVTEIDLEASSSTVSWAGVGEGAWRAKTKSTTGQWPSLPLRSHFILFAEKHSKHRLQPSPLRFRSFGRDLPFAMWEGKRTN